MFNWWFTAFREYGDPTFYGEQKTPVTLDIPVALSFIGFLIPSLSFLLILPGVRKKKTSSVITFLFSMGVGVIIIEVINQEREMTGPIGFNEIPKISLIHPCWHRAETDILTQFRSFSSEKSEAHILMRVGLRYMNISLVEMHNDTVVRDGFQYNERFSFTEVFYMKQELSMALRKGLPFPILKVIEYMSIDGFGWGRLYRVAGHYTYSCMWLALFCWVFSLYSLLFLPKLYSKCTVMIGIALAVGDLIFYCYIPRDMQIHFPTAHGSTILQFRLSICFKATCFTAVLCYLLGGTLCFLEYWNIYHLDTIFTTTRNTEDSEVHVKRLMSPVLEKVLLT